jgi:hypothetical protein
MNKKVQPDESVSRIFGGKAYFIQFALKNKKGRRIEAG